MDWEDYSPLLQLSAPLLPVLITTSKTERIQQTVKKQAAERILMNSTYSMMKI